MSGLSCERVVANDLKAVEVNGATLTLRGALMERARGFEVDLTADLREFLSIVAMLVFQKPDFKG